MANLLAIHSVGYSLAGYLRPLYRTTALASGTRAISAGSPAATLSRSDRRGLAREYKQPGQQMPVEL